MNIQRICEIQRGKLTGGLRFAKENNVMVAEREKSHQKILPTELDKNIYTQNVINKLQDLLSKISGKREFGEGEDYYKCIGRLNSLARNYGLVDLPKGELASWNARRSIIPNSKVEFKYWLTAEGRDLYEQLIINKNAVFLRVNKLIKEIVAAFKSAEMVEISAYDYIDYIRKRDLSLGLTKEAFEKGYLDGMVEVLKLHFDNSIVTIPIARIKDVYSIN